MSFTLTSENGRLTGLQLTAPDYGPNGAQELRTDAAASWSRMIAAGMTHGCLRSGYRTLAQQAAQVATAGQGVNGTAAPVGTSFHGEGIAADVDEPAQDWIITNGAEYGWIDNQVPGERWHMQYDPARDQHTTPTPTAFPTTITKDDDMPSIVHSSTYGYALLDGGRFIGLGDQATVDAWRKSGAHEVSDPIPDADWFRMIAAPISGILLFNPDSENTKGEGWYYYNAGHAVGLTSMEYVNALMAQGAGHLTVDSNQLHHFKTD